MSVWPVPPAHRLHRLSDEGFLQRVDRRLMLVVTAMLEQLPPAPRVHVAAHALVAARLGLQPQTAHDPDGNVWLVLPSLSGEPWMLIPGFEIGLWWINGQLWYCADPIHDDDLVEVTEC